MARRMLIVFAALIIAVTVSVPAPSEAGCGCEKPPPPEASIRPAFASPGDEVTLFGSLLVPDRMYTAIFANAEGTKVVNAAATARRDFADAQMKPQLVVAAPDLPPGPTQVYVVASDGTVAVDVPASEFTMMQAAVKLPEANAVTFATCYRAAVATDGTVYLPVDISAVAERMVFSGIGRSFPLLYLADDIAIYNTQGVLMQLLGPGEAGIFAIYDEGQPDSFELLYDRHEFETYRAAHRHEDGYGLDPADPAWHVDGTRHIDHDHLVIAIRGIVENEGMPQPGVTPPFTLDIANMIPDSNVYPLVTQMIEWSGECAAAAPPAAPTSTTSTSTTSSTSSTSTTIPTGDPAGGSGETPR
jgi:hypothetical protein